MGNKRHELVFARYISILKRYGKLASRIDKSMLYEESGSIFLYKAETSGKIIRAMMRDKDRRKNIESDPELKEILAELESETI